MLAGVDQDLTGPVGGPEEAGDRGRLDELRPGTENVPYIVALRDNHMIGAAGNEIYARGLKGAEVDTRYSIIHVDEKLTDPDTGAFLGYSGMYVGSGPVATAGDPAKLVLAESTREALQGDKLFPEEVDVKLDFVPHAPSSEIDASVIAVAHSRASAIGAAGDRTLADGS